MVHIYKNNLRLSEKSEAIAKGWVDSASTIWDGGLSRPEIQAIVLAEEAYLEKSVSIPHG
eukprot:407223-Prorocentrum_lima.AAC.1